MRHIKSIVKKVPLLNSLARWTHIQYLNKTFSGSGDYWRSRYKNGGNSGDGSYNLLAEFKAKVLNTFVSENAVSSIIEFGCGDGNQLTLANYPDYTGLDVSQDAIEKCEILFSQDLLKRFKLLVDFKGEKAELTLSLDVIYHLVEDDVFDSYMKKLFESSDRYVVIYSSNKSEQGLVEYPHVKHREFTLWVKNNKPGWQMKEHIKNEYDFNGDTRTSSCADFYIYEKEAVGG